MNEKNPPPPKVNEVFYGPRIGMSLAPGKYHVRAIVDSNKGEDPRHAWLYQIVFRFWVSRRGWAYEVVSAHALGVGLYTKTKRKPKKKP